MESAHRPGGTVHPNQLILGSSGYREMKHLGAVGGPWQNRDVTHGGPGNETRNPVDLPGTETRLREVTRQNDGRFRRLYSEGYF